jgi:hypothetical protein
VQLFCLARIMGPSVQQIDQVYGHLLPDSEEYLRGLLDAHDDVVDLAWTQATASSPKSLQNGAMRMRGLEPPRGSQRVGGWWRIVRFAGANGRALTARRRSPRRFTD